MSILLHKEKEHPTIDPKNIQLLSKVRFISALGFAFISTIWAVYVDSFFNDISKVGFFSGSLTLIAFLSYFLFIPIIEREDKAKIYKIALLGAGISYIFLAITSNFYLFILLSGIIAIFGTLRVTSFGIMLKDKSEKKSLSKNVGLTYVFANMAWFIGPLAAGFILSKMGIKPIFLFGAGFLFLSLIFFRKSHITDNNHKEKIDKNPIKSFITFFKNKNRVLAYIIGGGVDFWLTLIYLFMPLYIIRTNLGPAWIGYFLGATVIPLVSLEYYFSKKAEIIGFKKIFQRGFLIMSVLTIACFFITNIYLIMILLILANIGVAMVEPTTEAYFLDILKKKEALRFYGPYNTTNTVNKLLSKTLPATLLLFLPFKFIFMIFGISAFLIFLLCYKMQDVIEVKN